MNMSIFSTSDYNVIKDDTNWSICPQDFNVVDTTDQQVFIAIDFEGNIANLYLSDITGQYYVTSVENVVGLRYPGKFDVDLVKVGCKKKKNLYLYFALDLVNLATNYFCKHLERILTL